MTHGCGKKNCSNKSCAQYRNKPLVGNEGAVIALKLFREKAELCVGETQRFTGRPDIAITVLGTSGSYRWIISQLIISVAKIKLRAP